ncbi:hypothetical protein EVAR_49636_1 [Eumeta japonica]|uniref:Uncharacterized protein n=1 Tax=Eumeta variegata TaxID=151549 RepID=A0A4C1YB04_EUMVA|nr:hypothetical protein EVAR_49636_1 [Eumeta japonica]
MYPKELLLLLTLYRNKRKASRLETNAQSFTQSAHALAGVTDGRRQMSRRAPRDISGPRPPHPRDYITLYTHAHRDVPTSRDGFTLESELHSSVSTGESAGGHRSYELRRRLRHLIIHYELRVLSDSMNADRDDNMSHGSIISLTLNEARPSSKCPHSPSCMRKIARFNPILIQERAKRKSNSANFRRTSKIYALHSAQIAQTTALESSPAENNFDITSGVHLMHVIAPVGRLRVC